MAIGRSENMRRIRSKNTVPELTVRKLLRELGFTGYRLHRRELPGKPDIAFVGRKKAIMIHGCFWHGHECKEGMRRPKSNAEYWIPKIDRNRARDALHAEQLNQLGWRVLTLWECELRDYSALAERLVAFMTEEASTVGTSSI
ncbi:very short patch repair endonuclease [Burkholderia pseudomallei]|uniref:very short patch repair endonuclease n=1 Tax=Burkholderia pseudomallei TaxID=28450 RepID=UPI0005DF123E|nr:very short patch repair endonuclease [Burkholderia pseudomallei]BEH31534.1 very short patch repair endonuclease [Burkholderia pseudomallei]CAK1273224.1 DNA mismatch endonuclease Vsr [Burkholderia pseudomallei]CAK1281284.1 DNA mismatch endonuclease Vsr [Burkholderia pseudomallei]